MTGLADIKNSFQTSKGLIGFYESYREVPWPELLNSLQSSFDIVVYYWDQWIQQHFDALTSFLQKPGTHMNLVLADESNPAIMNDLMRLFPNKSHEKLIRQIADTYEPLRDYVKQYDLPINKVEVFRLPYLLNYSLQCLDGKTLILSFFEMYRSQQQVGGPAIVINLEQAPQLKQFYLKEIKGMCQPAFNIFMR